MLYSNVSYQFQSRIEGDVLARLRQCDRASHRERCIIWALPIACDQLSRRDFGRSWASVIAFPFEAKADKR